MRAGIYFLLKVKQGMSNIVFFAFFCTTKFKFERAENTPSAAFWERNSYQLSLQEPLLVLNCTPICLQWPV